ncbi:MAG: hypothetical protein MPW14_22490 [Candidatus Manganitrophus sp.]|nr:MAG: hypothetical protein MPW14_22490 [Candidatus Manganitrophus sp.]
MGRGGRCRGKALHDQFPNQMERFDPVEFAPDRNRHLPPRLHHSPHLFESLKGIVEEHHAEPADDPVEPV